MGKKHKTTCRWDVFWADILRTISQFYQYLLYRLYVSSNKVVYRLSGDQKLICTFIIGHLRTAQIAKNCRLKQGVNLAELWKFSFLGTICFKVTPLLVRSLLCALIARWAVYLCFIECECRWNGLWIGVDALRLLLNNEMLLKILSLNVLHWILRIITAAWNVRFNFI